MVFHTRPFKKDITPFARGGKVVKHVGKGARESSSGSSVTGGNPLSSMSNNYAKPAPADFAATGPGLGGPSLGAAPVPMGSQPPSAPSAMMPPDIGAGDDVE